MIEARKATFEDLFNSSDTAQIRVPDYQRGFSWKKKEVKEFFDDLISYRHNGRDKARGLKYFLGPIVLMKGGRADNYFFAVDGQQRMATFVIFMAVIRDVSVERFELFGQQLANKIQKQVISSLGPGGNHRWAYRLGDLDQPFFEKFVQKFPRVEHSIPNNSSNGLIKKAWNTLYLELGLYLDTQPDPFISLEEIYKMLLHDLELVAIEVKGEREAMNVFERINVRGVPLSESDLIRHRLMSGCVKDERARLRKNWDQMEVFLGGENEKIDRFLRHMWISRTGERPSSKLYDEISEHLELSGASPQEFVESALTDCEIYTEILKPHSQFLHQASRKSVRAVHSTLGVKEALPVFLSAYRRFERAQQFALLASAIESLVVRYVFFANHDKNELTESLYRCSKLIQGAPSRGQAFQDAMAALKAINPTNAQVVSGTQRQMKLKKNHALYILREIEDSLGDGAFQAKATLEHIFPQKAVQQDWGRAVGRLEPYMSHIGNLTLLAASDNSKASNRGFSFKKKKVYRESTVELTRRIGNVTSWGLKPMLRRAEDLARLANQRWNIS